LIVPSPISRKVFVVVMGSPPPHTLHMGPKGSQPPRAPKANGGGRGAAAARGRRGRGQGAGPPQPKRCADITLVNSITNCEGGPHMLFSRLLDECPHTDSSLHRPIIFFIQFALCSTHPILGGKSPSAGIPTNPVALGPHVVATLPEWVGGGQGTRS